MSIHTISLIPLIVQSPPCSHTRYRTLRHIPLITAYTKWWKATDLDLKGEVLLQVLDDHHQEGQLDPQSLLGVSWARDVRSAADHRDGGRVN